MNAHTTIKPAWPEFAPFNSDLVGTRADFDETPIFNIARSFDVIDAAVAAIDRTAMQTGAGRNHGANLILASSEALDALLCNRAECGEDAVLIAAALTRQIAMLEAQLAPDADDAGFNAIALGVRHLAHFLAVTFGAALPTKLPGALGEDIAESIEHAKEAADAQRA